MQAFSQWCVELGRNTAGALLGLVRSYWLLLLMLAAILTAFVALRTPASPVASVSEVDAILRGGRPVLVEFFSNT